MGLTGHPVSAALLLFSNLGRPLLVTHICAELQGSNMGGSEAILFLLTFVDVRNALPCSL